MVSKLQGGLHSRTVNEGKLNCRLDVGKRTKVSLILMRLLSTESAMSYFFSKKVTVNKYSSIKGLKLPIVDHWAILPGTQDVLHA